MNTPQSVQPAEHLAKDTVAPPAREITPPVTTPSETSRLSERLLDPEKFKGLRLDLRRFVTQIHAKLKTNSDRFITAQSRMNYVASRLRPVPYA